MHIRENWRDGSAVNNIDWLFSRYILWFGGSIARLGHLRNAFTTGSPVRMPYFLAEMDFARTTPWRDFLSPPMIDGISRRSTFAPFFNCSTAVQLK